MKIFAKIGLIELVETLENGNVIVQNKGNDSDRWEIPKDVFLSTYTSDEDVIKSIEKFNRGEYPTNYDMDFGEAINALKQGKKVARRGWNGKGMFIMLIGGSKNIIPYPGTPYSPVIKHTGKETISILPHLDMFTAQGDMLCGWLAYQTDMLAKDWEIVN